MREYFEPIYFQSTFQGAPNCGQQQQQQQPGKSILVKKSNSVVGGGSVSRSVLGRFLKIGKSKSDVQGTSKSRASTYNSEDLEEDFRLSPSVLNRGPVEKMVHKSNSRKDVSRSHSWIYGSVKLPSDLPFGYGYANGFGGNLSPSGSDSHSGGSGSPSNGHHTHGVTALQIPRCQMVDYYCSCDCTGDFDFLTAGPGENPPNNGPCKACAYDWAVNGGKSSKNRKQGSRNSNDSGADTGKTFASSVRKLTWKSLKQAVKKRPSLDNMKKQSDLRIGLGGSGASPNPFASPSGVEMYSNPNGIPVILGSHGNLLEGSNSEMSAFYHNRQHAFSADDLQPSYFFPDKKNIYSSCVDIHRDPPPHVTASVRVRPKPSRQSWQFPNEAGPVPNYQEDDLYHSEWDLRQCIPYDVWVSTTSNVKPRTTLPSSSRPKTPTLGPGPEAPSRNTSLSKSTSVPYLCEIKNGSERKSPIVSNGMNGKSLSSGAVSNNDTISIKSIESIKGSGTGTQKSASNGVVKRSSILSTDVNAYQLLKAQTRNTKSPNNTTQSQKRIVTNRGDDLDDALSSSSDDLSDNALTSESHMRIAGQKIYMAPNLNGNQQSSSSSSSTLSNGRTSSSASSRSSTFSQQIQSQTNKIRQGKPSSEEDEWSADEASSNQQNAQNKHVSMSRDRNQLYPDKANKGFVELTDKDTGNVKIGQHKIQSGLQAQKSRNGIHVGPNNGNYDNCRENNGARSSFTVENGHNNNTSSFNQPTTRNTSNSRINQYQHTQSHRDSTPEQPDCVEFEEFVFEEEKSHDEPNPGKSSLAKATDELLSQAGMKSFRIDSTSLTMSAMTSSTPNMRNPLVNSISNSQRPGYIKNGRNKPTQNPLVSSIETKPVAPNVTINNGSKSSGKFGALRRRKSRNGSTNPGKLLREVIYEEEMEHEQNYQQQHTSPKDSFSHGDDIKNAIGPSYETSQRSNKSNEYAVKIVVSHSSGSTEYVKPILKNRERVYDTPITNPSFNTDKGYNFNSSHNNNNNNEIYFDSSISTTSTSKKKVQFDQNKVTVCGGDSGPESDEYTNYDEDLNQEKSQGDNHHNENNDSSEEVDEDHTYRNDDKTSLDTNKMNENHYHYYHHNHHDETKEESRSVSLKSNLSRKSALTDNHDNLSQNQSELPQQKTRSSFEEEVVRKAAAFALARKKQAEEAEATAAIAEAQKAAATTGANLTRRNNDEDKNCYDGSVSVNNLRQVRLNEDQSRLTSTSTNNHANMTTTSSTSPVKRKSNLKSNLKSALSKSSQGTGSITRNPEPTQQQGYDRGASMGNGGGGDDKDNSLSSSNTNSRMNQRQFLQNSSNNKTSHGVTSSVMKAQRIANSADERSPVKGCSPQQQQKIVNPNSLLFNDTTRIRLNQSRPSMNETFKLNLSQNGQATGYGSNHLSGSGTTRGTRLKQSNSFRTIGSIPLRPREPPPPPPVALRNGSALTKSSPRLQKNFLSSSSSSLIGQVDKKVLSKSVSSNQIYNSSQNGNRLPTKSEISLPMGLQTTSNQASSAIKNQSTYEQKDDCGSNNANANMKSSSGFETNGAKTQLGPRTSLNNNNHVDNSKKHQVNANGGSRSKSLSDRCEALDKVLGQQYKAKANANNTSNKKEYGANNNQNNKHEEIEVKMRSQSGEILQNTNGQNVTKSHTHQIGNFNEKYTAQQARTISDSQSIEIVTKENSVSEIRIYSGTGSSANNRGNDDKVIYESTKTVINNEKNKCFVNNIASCINNNGTTQEIHYAATDLFPQNEFLNERKQFRQPAPLPPIPQESIVTQSRPQSTSVVLIIDNNGNNNSNSKNADIVEASSPITYSQPVDTLPKSLGQLKSLPTSAPPLPPLNPASPLTPKANDLSPYSSNNASNPNESDDGESEPLYDDVINHSVSTTDLTAKQGSIGRKSLISSISSRKQSRKPLSNFEEISSRSRPSQLPPTPPQPQVSSSGHIVSSTLPCLACPPSLPPPNLPSKNLSEFHNRPVVLDEDEGERNAFSSDLATDANIDEEVDNLYNDISDGGSTHGKSLQSLASSMKGALLNAIKNMDFDRRSMLSTASNNSNGSSSTKRDEKSNDIYEESNFIYDDTLSLRSSTYGYMGGDTTKSYYQPNNVTSPLKSPEKEPALVTKSLPPPSASIRSGLTVAKPLDNLMEQDEPVSDDPDSEPLYDDVVNLPQRHNSNSSEMLKKALEASNSSDSGAESEDAIPPPLPAQGPPPKISCDLPLLTFPLLLNKNTSGSRDSLRDSSDASREGSVEKIIGIIIDPVQHQSLGTPRRSGSETLLTTLNKSEGNSNGGRKEDEVLTRTRSLLNELNEKLSQLNITPSTDSSNSAGTTNLMPLDFSTYSPNTKAAISSSSESSGVEEDYNSERNYSLSNSSDVASASSSSADEGYKLTQVTKLVTETITMARGKFLDSMKVNSMNLGSSSTLNSPNNPVMMLSSNGTSPVSSDGSGISPSIAEEPIYEEIGDMNRSTSPIYADAFDAKSIFDGASRNEILSFLESIRDRLTASDSNSSGSQSSSISSKKGNESERNDSGIGSEPGSLVALSKSSTPTLHEEQDDEAVAANKLVLRKLCPDCNDVPLGDDETSSQTLQEDSTSSTKHLCNSCNRKRNERKEIITEIHETEMKYGRDLKIISEEFYKPIQIAGLLTKEQLDQIFLNVVELMEMSAHLTSLLKADIQSACVERHDEDLTSVNVGKIFLEIGESMMTAFQTYCTRQASAGALLAQLEKEKELLRIFLRVSQMENTVLRRMNLPAFLMVPVQRVTRYPLLLSRLLKVTPVDHFSRDELQSAHEKIEQHLEHMNKSTREVASVKLWRRISIINGNSTPLPRRSNNDLEGASVSIRKMAIDVLDWTSLSDVTCVLDNQLSAFHFNGKPLRGIYGCLLARGKDLETLAAKMDRDMFFPPAEDLVKEVKLVLVRVKNTRFCLLREPLCLSKCVISQGENEFHELIEINEITTKNTYYLQGMDKQATATWLNLLQCYSMCVGQWRRRRGALANIMMNGMLRHL